MHELVKSDVVMYYLALFLACIGIVMMIIFVPFKSVATLMMMLSGLGLVTVGAAIVTILIFRDLKKKYLD